MSKLSETTLAEAVIIYLTQQHWDVYQEVSFFGGAAADIAAVRCGYLWIIECKTSFTFTVLEQANNWKTHYRSVAIPAAQNLRGRYTAYRIAHDYLRLGVLEFISPNRGIREEKPAPFMREFHKNAKRLIGALKPEHKFYTPAGSANTSRYTPYRDTMDTVHRFVANHPGCDLKTIMDYIGSNHHYSTATSAKNSIRIALGKWEADWCEVKMNEKNQLIYFAKPGTNLRFG